MTTITSKNQVDQQTKRAYTRPTEWEDLAPGQTEAELTEAQQKQRYENFLKALRQAYNGDLNEDLAEHSNVIELLAKHYQVEKGWQNKTAGNAVAFINKDTGNVVYVSKDEIKYDDANGKFEYEDAVEMVRFAMLDVDMQRDGFFIRDASPEQQALIEAAVAAENAKLPPQHQINVRNALDPQKHAAVIAAATSTAAAHTETIEQTAAHGFFSNPAPAPAQPTKVGGGDMQMENADAAEPVAADDAQEVDPDAAEPVAADDAQEVDPDAAEPVAADDAQEVDPDAVEPVAADDAQEVDPDAAEPVAADDAQKVDPDAAEPDVADAGTDVKDALARIRAVVSDGAEDADVVVNGTAQEVDADAPTPREEAIERLKAAVAATQADDAEPTAAPEVPEGYEANPETGALILGAEQQDAAAAMDAAADAAAKPVITDDDEIDPDLEEEIDALLAEAIAEDPDLNGTGADIDALLAEAIAEDPDLNGENPIELTATEPEETRPHPVFSRPGHINGDRPPVAEFEDDGEPAPLFLTKGAAEKAKITDAAATFRDQDFFARGVPEADRKIAITDQQLIDLFTNNGGIEVPEEPKAQAAFLTAVKADLLETGHLQRKGLINKRYVLGNPSA